MKKIIAAIVIVLLTACSAQKSNVSTAEKVRSNSAGDKLFRMGLDIACDIKGGDKRACDCQSDVLYDAAEPELRANFSADPQRYQLALVSLMLENSDALEACKKPVQSENMTNSQI
ncbi:hypothetical protein MHO82_12965 [Vibrio sp. Of7-15]|uniref:hypothetical protein n=1 Tax=Vibrio sp. Of7-15 TaxID=2724879 RepID=UPI001EF29487|nr:hypothetical protein [Vibrio sp. Of7-15]MCG7497775.1 hypothetical protein [Vibrio sp. Of7-15]